MRRFLSLPCLTAAVWLAWLGLMGLLAGMLAGRAWHPHFLPATAMLAMVVIAGGTLVVGASWRIIRGPRRRQAVTCLLVGVAPLLLLVAPGLYGLEIGYGRNIPLTVPIKLLIPLGESLMDLEARMRFPQRTWGEKVVMISTPVADAREQVAAMDRHVRALETRLGRPTSGRVHWVRGTLMGMQGGHAVFGLCMGSRPGSTPLDAEGLASIDRHEVAHCVLNSHCPVGVNSPALLTEGWAEANSGHDAAELARRLWERRNQGDDYTLRELTGPAWYDRHEWPVYVRGAVLVNSILERFGAEGFVRLYTTCRPESIDDDCRRILGVGLDELDAVCREGIGKQLDREGAAAARLRGLRLGGAVNALAWQAFLDEYLPAVKRLLAPYDNVRLTSEYLLKSTDPHGNSRDFEEHSEIQRSGRYCVLRTRTKDGEDLYLADPRRSLKAQRKSPGEGWEVPELAAASPERSYRRMLSAIDRHEAVTRAAATLFELAEEFQNLVDTSHIVVAKLEPFTEGGCRYVRVGLEVQTPWSSVAPWRSFTVVHSADDHFAARSNEIERFTGARLRSEFVYDRYDGLPVMRSLRTSGAESDGTHTASELRVVERRFEPTPESEFAPERLLAGSPVRQVVDADPDASDRVAPGGWFWAPLVGAMLCLIGAVAVGLSGESRDSVRHGPDARAAGTREGTM